MARDRQADADRRGRAADDALERREPRQPHSGREKRTSWVPPQRTFYWHITGYFELSILCRRWRRIQGRATDAGGPDGSAGEFGRWCRRRDLNPHRVTPTGF